MTARLIRIRDIMWLCQYLTLSNYRIEHTLFAVVDPDFFISVSFPEVGMVSPIVILRVVPPPTDVVTH